MGFAMRQRVLLSRRKKSSTANVDGEREPEVAERELEGTSERATSAAYHHRFWRVVGYGARVGRPGGLLTGWWLWDRISKWLWPAFVPAECPHGTLKVRVVASDRPQVCLPDSSTIRTGARIVEIHCNNITVLAMARSGECIIAACRQDLSGIATWLTHHDDQVEAIVGATVLGAAAARMGFHRRNLPLTWRVRAARLFMNGLLALYHRDGIARLSRGRTLTASPQEIWMSRKELMRLYGKPTEASHSADVQAKQMVQQARTNAGD
jgi:hypothetical protein